MLVSGLRIITYLLNLPYSKPCFSIPKNEPPCPIFILNIQEHVSFSTTLYNKLSQNLTTSAERLNKPYLPISNYTKTRHLHFALSSSIFDFEINNYSTTSLN